MPVTLKFNHGQATEAKFNFLAACQTFRQASSQFPLKCIDPHFCVLGAKWFYSIFNIGHIARHGVGSINRHNLSTFLVNTVFGLAR